MRMGMGMRMRMRMRTGLVSDHPVVRVPQPHGNVQLCPILAGGDEVADAELPAHLELLQEDAGLGLGGDDHPVSLLEEPLLFLEVPLLGQGEGQEQE